MSATPATPVIAVLTPEQKGVFFDLIKSSVPNWLLTSSSELRRQLHDSLTASHGTRSELASLLKGLQAPADFCSPLLAKALSDKLGTPFEPVGVVFQHVRSTSSLLGLRKKLVLPIDRDLLSAACENFELSETLSANYSDSSTLYIPEKITGSVNKVLAIEPHEFALLCRKLDLGKQYQAHIKSLFEPAAATNDLSTKYVAHAKNSFDVKRHVALMTKAISVEVHKALQAVKSLRSLTLGDNTLGYQALKMFDVTINGALFIGPVGEHDDDDYRCVVYLPDDPLHPLKQYASFNEFELELSQRLKKNEFRQHFLRYIKLGERVKFVQALDKGLTVPGGSPLPPNNIFVSVTGADIPGDPFQEMFRQHSSQLLADSRLLVVPTDDEDEKTRLDRLETYKNIGFNIFVLGASFLPVVGHIMLAVTALQILSEVYEGVANWARGEQEQATDCLFDTVENLILMAAFAAGTAAAGATFRAIRTSAFVERLREIPGKNSRGRLWNPNLAVYQQSLRLPKSLSADARGLQWLGDQAYLSIDTGLYAVRPKVATDLWEVMAPLGSDETYSPLLETNDAGAWRHDSELPQEWDRLKLFRRFGYSRDEFSDTTVGQILAVCAIDDSVMRQAHVDRSQPPALLVDTVQRFRADAAVTEFIAQINDPVRSSQADPDLQLHLLTGSGHWPGIYAVKVVNLAGRQVDLHGTLTAGGGRIITLNQDVLRRGQLHASLLSALNRTHRENLLGTHSADATEQKTALARIIAEQAESSRPQLFERIYQRSQETSDARVSLLMVQFAQLPRGIAEELLRYAEAGELDALEAGNIPLRLAEEARRYLQVAHLSRAYEGLYLGSSGGFSTDQLVLDTLKQLPGWTNDAWVQISDSSGAVSQSISIGPEQAAQKVRVDVLVDGYRVSVDAETSSTTFRQRTRERYFEALWHGLSAARKQALGVSLNDAGGALREKITQLALTRRTAIAQVVDALPSWSGYTSPMRLADRPVSAQGAGRPDPVLISSSHDVMVRRALELYPLLSPAKIHALVSGLGTNEIAVLTRLEALRLEFQTIRQALSQWVVRKTWHLQPDGSRQEVARVGKYRAAQTIIRCWRKEPEFTESGDEVLATLMFDAQPLGDLPLIIGDFSHVGRLVINGVGASAGLNAFLRNFHDLRRLSLRGNHLTRLPLALAEMTRLEQLDLSNNSIQLTTDSVTLLAGMTRLESVDLSFNPQLTRAPDVSRLLHLEQLNLRGTAITQWPVGAAKLLQLRELDLRDNQIETLPDEALAGNALQNRGINLHGNPLSADALTKVAEHQRKTGMSLGIIASEYRRPGTYSPPRAQSLEWLVGLGEVEAQRRQRLWDSLQAYPGSTRFFDVLARLSNTADFTHIYHHFSARVWNVMEAAATDDRLRRSLFRQVQVSRLSADGYSATFSEMEVQVLCYRATVAAATGIGSLEQQLITLLRGLFRLQEVERIALADINARPGSASASYAHALEISLAYRVGLAERLALPSQPRAILSRWNVEVSAAALERANQSVLVAERTSALQEWMLTQRFWVEYLEASHPDQLLAITDRAALRFAQIERQPQLTREVATQRTNAIVDNFRNERRTLFGQLTSQALTRHPALVPPGVSAESEVAT